jgi:hypothetical protein
MLALIAIAAAGPATAFDVGDGLLSVSGFGRWGYGNTDGNAYLLGRDVGKGDNIGMALNIFAKPMDRVAVSSQFFYDASKINIDWAFAEYRIEDWLRFRAGQVKMPFAAYMETKDVGTLRPFYNLPASIYSFGDIGAESYFGGGFSGFIPPFHGWEVTYDAFFGQIWLESNDRFRSPQTALNLGAAASDQYANPGQLRQTVFTRVDNTYGGRLAVQTPIQGLRFWLSGYRGTVAEIDQTQGATPGDNVHAAGLSIEYARDWWELRAEGFRKDEGTTKNGQKITTGYVEAAVRLPYGFQLAGRAESATYDLADDTFDVCSWTLGPGSADLNCAANAYRVPNSLRRHVEFAVGLNYWLSSDFVIKTSYHWINGNRFAVPEYPWNNYTTDGLPNADPDPGEFSGSLNDVSYDSKTQMLLIGAQFAF